MKLDRSDYFEFVALLARMELAQTRAAALVARAEKPLAECAARLSTQYAGFPRAATSWTWNDRTCEVAPAAGATIDPSPSGTGRDDRKALGE